MTDESRRSGENAEDGDDPVDDLFNPFVKHLAMADRTGMTVSTAEGRPSSPKLFVPTIEPKVSDDFVDWEFLDLLKTWGGALKEPHVKTEEEFDQSITAALKDTEPQFILRNLARIERHADPDKPIRLETEEVRYGMLPDNVRQQIAGFWHEPLRLVELGTEALAQRQRWMRWLRDELQWEDHFAKELKADNPGAVWQRAPDGPLRVVTQTEPGPSDGESLS